MSQVLINQLSRRVVLLEERIAKLEQSKVPWTVQQPKVDPVEVSKALVKKDD